MQNSKITQLKSKILDDVLAYMDEYNDYYEDDELCKKIRQIVSKGLVDSIDTDNTIEVNGEVVEDKYNYDFTFMVKFGDTEVAHECRIQKEVVHLVSIDTILENNILPFRFNDIGDVSCLVYENSPVTAYEMSSLIRHKVELVRIPFDAFSNILTTFLNK
jgi:hypothetical protein